VGNAFASSDAPTQRRWCVRATLTVVLALSACRTHQRTGVLLNVLSEGPPPEHVELTWLDADQVVFRRRLPESGVLAPENAGRFTVFVERREGAGPRRGVARGLAGDRVISEGTFRAEAVGSGIATAVVTLRAATLPDRDHDGLPDDIDDCPAYPDGDGHCGPDVDAAAGDAAETPDAAGPDAPTLESGPDSLPPGQRDAPTVDDAAPVDGPPDQRPDLRPPAKSDVLFAVGSFVASGGEQVITHGLGATPRALLIWTTGAPDEGVSRGWSFSIGVSDGPSKTSRALAVANTDGAATTTGSRRIARKIVSLVRPDQSVAAEADLTAWDSDQLTLTWTTSDGVPALLHYALVGGKVSAKVLEWHTPATSGPSSVAGVGFRPSVVMNFNAGGDFTAASPAVAAGASLGWGTITTAGPQWASAVVSPSGAAPSRSAGAQHRDDGVYMFSGDGLTVREGSFTSMEDDGFSFSFRNVGAAATVVSLALGGLPAMAGSFLKTDAVAPVTQTVGAVGFRPGLLLLSSFENIAQNPPVPDARFGVGASDGFTQVSSALGDRAGQAASSVASVSRRQRVFLKARPESGLFEAEASSAAFASDAFSVQWSTNDPVAAEVNFLVLGSP
jgi:hypothetical protein